MSGFPPPPPGFPPPPGLPPSGMPPTLPCRNCLAPVLFGAPVCPRCGAAAGYVPKPERANNTRATLGGVASAIAVLYVLPFLASAAGRYDAAVLGIVGLVDIGSFVAALVVLMNTARRLPLRAFAFAFLMTIVATFVLGVLIVAGLFVACLIGISAYSHAHAQ